MFKEADLSSKEHLVVFGRYPVPGRTKTRLIPHIGEIQAADLQRELTEKIIHTSYYTARQKRSGIHVEFCMDGGSEGAARRWIGIDHMVYSMQSEGNLGQRMHAVFISSKKRGFHRTVLIGTDIQGLCPAYLNDAFDALSHHDLVIGPTADGGYGLIGMNSPLPIFENIPWGSPDVFRETLHLAESKGISVGCLPSISDIDTLEDLSVLPESDRFFHPFISVIIPALNEEKSISKTIERARTPSSEVIVVDGRSCDRTVQVAEAQGAKVIGGVTGRSFQQNAGAMMAKGSVLLFLHADTLLPKQFDRMIFESLLNHRLSLGAFRFRTDWQTLGMRWIEAFVHLRSLLLKLPYGDQAFFLRKKVFDAMDGFDEVPIAEDLMLARKARKAGSVEIVPAYAVTSARRWRKLGIIRTTWINTLIAAGVFAGISPSGLAHMYGRWRPGKNEGLGEC